IDRTIGADRRLSDRAGIDQASAAGRGELCTAGSCPAPYTCVIPDGYTQGYCLEACTTTCTSRNQVCESLGDWIAGTYCLDVVQRGASCWEVYQMCEAGTECYITAEDADGNPTEARCKQTCDVVGTGICTTPEVCVATGYVDVEYDANGDPVLCETNPNACTSPYTCMDLQYSDGRPVKACAKELGWCGTAGGIGAACNPDLDQYCQTELPGAAAEAAWGYCDGVCWFICFLPADYTGTGSDMSFNCDNSSSCGDPASSPLPDGVLACVPNVDGGIRYDAAGRDTTRPDVPRTDAARPDTTVVGDGGCQPCGNVTFYGACQDNTLVWCGSDNCLHGVDCTSGDPSLHCALFNTSWGYDCLAGVGQQCDPAYPGDQNNPPDYAGCDPALGYCNPQTYICTASADGGVGADSGSVDAGACIACGSVDEYGACSDTLLVWCTDGCLYGFDCNDYGRHCIEVTLDLGDEQIPWADCFGDTGDLCVPDGDYFNNLNMSYVDPYWLCDPWQTSGCPAIGSTCQ
ncbi:MAG: hypothetical protein JXR83_09760, partial [Deltaproteobacteria bacterium]|nr:hypothetical protein [Deltaproteobacteria bacterium]